MLLQQSNLPGKWFIYSIYDMIKFTFSFDVGQIPVKYMRKVDEIGSSGQTEEDEGDHIYLIGSKQHFHFFINFILKVFEDCLNKNWNNEVSVSKGRVQMNTSYTIEKSLKTDTKSIDQ